MIVSKCGQISSCSYGSPRARAYANLATLKLAGLLAGALWLLLSSALVQAQAVFVGAGLSTNTGGSTVATMTINVPAGLALDDLLLAQISYRGGAATTITPAAGWTLVVRNDSAAGDIGQAIYRRFATVAEPATYDFGISPSSRAQGQILAYRNVATLAPIDASGGGVSASSSSIVAPSISTTTTNTLLVGFFAQARANITLTLPGTMTGRSTFETGGGPNGLTLAAADEVQAGAGASGSRTATSSNSAGTVGQMLALRPGVSVDHYRVQNNLSGINCQPEQITITAHSLGHVAVAATGRTIVITAARVAGAAGTHGDYALVSGTGTLTNGAADDGVASYTFGTGETTVILRYSNTWVQTINFSVDDGTVTDISGSASGDAGYDANLQFEPAGFRFVDSADAPITNQVAGVASGVFYLQAIQTGPGGCVSPGPCTGACVTPGPFFSGASVNVELASRCDDPVTCQPGQQVSIANSGTTPIAANAASGVVTWTTKNLLFGANGKAAFDLLYPDVGAISLHARYGLLAGSGNYMSGSSNIFVVAPYSFVVQSAGPNEIKRTADGFVNPAAATAADPAFIRAGDDFTVTVTAMNLAGNPTPNYGREQTAETVLLTANLVGGLGLSNGPALNNASAFGAFANGSATGTTFSWGEAGIITLTPTVGDGNYLGAGNVTGSASINVGRFIPFDFAVTRNVPIFDPGCSAAGKDAFTYMGEPFMYLTAPVITVTARNKAGATTQNYSGNFFKITQASLTGKSYTSATGTLDVSGLPANDPAIRYGGDGLPSEPAPGTATLTFDAGTGIKFTRSTPVLPFDADIALAINVIDSDATAVALIDGVAATNPIRFGQANAGNGILFSGVPVTPGKTAREMRFGRLRMENVTGTTRLALPLRARAQYFAANGFITNADDDCTSFKTSDVAMSFVGGTNLAACETALMPNGAITLSGGAVSGTRLTAPGSGNDGSVDLSINLAAASGNTCASAGGAPAAATFSALDYLQGNWGGSVGWDQNPRARATFGVYKNAAEFLYLQENY